MNISNKWLDYECLATGNKEKLERWGNIILNRPDPQIIWAQSNNPIWNKWDGYYHRSNLGGGSWEFRKRLPEFWTVNYKNLTFKVSPTNFKHTGIFPEQATNWDYIIEKIKTSDNKEFRVLNLFAYTGCATMAASSAGAKEVVHIDSSKGMNDWAKENVVSSGLQDAPVRFLVDDVIKFVEREIRRGNKYDAIVMDPPSYGRGANKEVWSIEKDLDRLLSLCEQILEEDYLFVCVNTYSTNLSLLTLENILKTHFRKSFVKVDEIAIPIEESNLYLPCGVTGWITHE